MFPFKYNGVTHEACTFLHAENNRAWCAHGITAGTEVPTDGDYWGDCGPSCTTEGIKL